MGNTNSTSSTPQENQLRAQLTGKYSNVQNIKDIRYGDITLLSDPKTGEKLCIKEILSKNSDDFVKEEAFLKKRSQIQHTNIIRLISYAHTDSEKLCATMCKFLLLVEYVNSDLSQELNQMTLAKQFYSEEKLTSMTEVLISAFCKLQTVGIVHGDIRPQRILMNNNGEYKVADNAIMGQTMPSYYQILSGFTEVQCYLSPILVACLKKGELRPIHNPYKSDVFSLGMIILYAGLMKNTYSLYNFKKYEINQSELQEWLKLFKETYSKRLGILVEDMLNIIEDKRPDFIKLMEKIKELQQQNSENENRMGRAFTFQKDQPLIVNPPENKTPEKIVKAEENSRTRRIDHEKKSAVYANRKVTPSPVKRSGSKQRSSTPVSKRATQPQTQITQQSQAQPQQQINEPIITQVNQGYSYALPYKIVQVMPPPYGHHIEAQPTLVNQEPIVYHHVMPAYQEIPQPLSGYSFNYDDPTHKVIKNDQPDQSIYSVIEPISHPRPIDIPEGSSDIVIQAKPIIEPVVFTKKEPENIHLTTSVQWDMQIPKYDHLGSITQPIQENIHVVAPEKNSNMISHAESEAKKASSIKRQTDSPGLISDTGNLTYTSIHQGEYQAPIVSYMNLEDYKNGVSNSPLTNPYNSASKSVASNTKKSSSSVISKDEGDLIDSLVKKYANLSKEKSTGDKREPSPQIDEIIKNYQFPKKENDVKFDSGSQNREPIKSRLVEFTEVHYDLEGNTKNLNSNSMSLPPKENLSNYGSQLNKAQQFDIPLSNRPEKNSGQSPETKKSAAPNHELVKLRETYPDGSTYEGSSLNGQRHGYGVIIYSDGGLYEGEWKYGAMDGKGTLYYGHGKIAYQGGWKEDKFHGKGVVYNDVPSDYKPDQEFDFRNFDTLEEYWTKYEGDFVMDNKDGFGVLYILNGDKFEGEFKGDLLQGKGVYIFKNGTKIAGIWNENRLIQTLNLD